MFTGEEGSVSFNQSWEKYRDGFGDVCGEFWLGNHYLNEMTGKYRILNDFSFLFNLNGTDGW